MRTIVTLFVAAVVAVGAVFLAPDVEGQVGAPVHINYWDLLPGRAWTHPTTGASMISYACTLTDRAYAWAPVEDSLLTLHVKVIARGQTDGSADYHSRQFTPPQPQQCDLRKGIDVVTFQLRNAAGAPVHFDWSLPQFQNARIVGRAYPQDNPANLVWGARSWPSFPGTRTGNSRPVTGQSDFDLIADPGERYEDVFGPRR